PGRAGPLIAAEHPGLRPGPADHRGVGGARAAPVRVHAAARRYAGQLRLAGHGLAAARDLGPDPGQRRPGTARAVYLRGPPGRPVAARADAGGGGRRPPDAAVRRPGAVLGPAGRGQPGLATRPGAGRPGARYPAGQLRHRTRIPGPRRNRLFRRAREDHLRARPGRGRGPGPGLRADRRGGPGAGPRPAAARDRPAGSRRSPGRPAGPALQAPVGPAGSRRRLDDVTGGGWVLLGYLADPAGDLPAELARWWAGIGGRCFQLTPDGPLQDSTGAYGRWFATLERDTVLIRPDSYLFGTAAGPGAAAGLAGALRSALGGAGSEATGSEAESRRGVW